MRSLLIEPNVVLRKARTAAKLISAPGGLRKIGSILHANFLSLNARLRGKPFIYVLQDGVRFVCVPRSATSLQLYVARGHGEEVEVKLCRAWLRKGDACLDIGANIGMMTASFAQTVGPDGVVVSVEPAPETYTVLCEGVRLLSCENVRALQACVSDRSGSVKFMAASVEGRDVFAAMKVRDWDRENFHAILVPAITIDDLLSKYGVENRVSLVKIDIEGAEPLALRAASRLFERERLPLFMVEIHRGSPFGFTPADILAFFPTELFDLFHVQRSISDLMPRFEHGRLYPLREDHDWPWLSNLIAAPRIGAYAGRRNCLDGSITTA
jgi:FkbM family methyltransferase